MAVETSVSQNINLINTRLPYDGFSSNYLKDYEKYSKHGSVHNFNNRYSTEINLSGLDIVDRHLQNDDFLKVQYNVLPPLPHNMVNYNKNNLYKKVEISKNGNLLNTRAISPKGYESDESCTSLYSSRGTTANKQDVTTKNQINRKNLSEQSIAFGKYSNSSPNVYYPNYYSQWKNLRNSSRYYSNGSTRSSKQSHKNHPVDNITRRVHGLMERFKSRSYLMRIDPSPEKLLSGGCWDQLNQAIWDVFSSKAQTEQTYIFKLEAWRSIFLSIKKCLNSYGLFIVGSTMSGFGLETSDIDLCLLTKSFVTDPRIDALHHLDHVRNLLLKNSVADDAELIVAKVPILKFKYLETGFEIDLNCNNGVGIRNTHLLHCYARLDWRVRPLVIIVKVWAQENNINDAKNMTISSYSLALMVIHYLQCGIAPPVLPCLHGLVPEIFNACGETTSTDVQEDIDFMKNFKSDNTNCLGELLIGFLDYYSYFKFSEFAISVRMGSRLPIDECRYLKAPKNDINQWKFLCIEEPFNFSNTARSVFDVDKFQFIKEVFRQSYIELSRNKILSSILPIQFNTNQR